MKDDYKPSDSADVMRFIQDSQNDPEKKKKIQEFLMLSACGMIGAIAQCKASGSSGIAGAMVVDEPPDMNPNRHAWCIRHKNKVMLARPRVDRLLDRAILALVSLREKTGPIDLKKWAILTGRVEEKLLKTLSPEDQDFFKRMSEVSLSSIFAVAACAEELAKVVMGKPQDGEMFADLDTDDDED